MTDITLTHYWPDKPPDSHLDPKTLSGHLFCKLKVGAGRVWRFEYYGHHRKPYRPISYRWSSNVEKVTCRKCLALYYAPPRPVMGLVEIV